MVRGNIICKIFAATKGPKVLKQAGKEWRELKDKSKWERMVGFHKKKEQLLELVVIPKKWGPEK